MDRDYISPISGQPCAAPQYLCDLVIKRQSHMKKANLPDKYWNLPEWKPEYRKQIRRAHALLKAYNAISIIRTLKSKRGESIYSLYFPGLPDMIEKEQIRIDKEEKAMENAKKIETVDPTSKPRQQFGKKNKFNKLRGLE